MQMSPRSLAELLRDLHEVHLCVHHYEQLRSHTKAQQSWQDYQGIVEEITARFALSPAQIHEALGAPATAPFNPP